MAERLDSIEERGWFASGPMSEDERRKLEAVRLGVPFVTLGRDDISIDSLVLIPEPLSRTANIIAYRHGDEGIEVALLDLADLPQIDFLRQTHRVNIRLTDRQSIKQALVMYQKHLKEKFMGLVQGSKDAAESLLKHALHSSAHYVHLEPAAASAAGVVVRYRIEGVLREAMRLPEETSRYIIERLKYLGKLFPVTTAVQEGSFTFTHDGEDVDVSMTAVPSVGGEKLSMRLSRQKNGAAGFSLQSLGLHGSSLELLHDTLQAQKGLVLVAGQGKTTLLYTMLDHVTGVHKAVATVEDKIEYRLPRVHQTVTRPDLGLTTSAALRAVLKQDPDTVMVSDLGADGAMELALAAAQRGIFILGGIKTQDGTTAHAQLVMIQRLVRRVAPHAKKRALTRAEGQLLEGKVSFAKVLAALKAEGVVHEHTAWKDILFYSAESGDPDAKVGAGYKGMVGVQEVRASSGETGLTLLEDALFKAVQGQTSIEEVAEIAGE